MPFVSKAIAPLSDPSGFPTHGTTISGETDPELSQLDAADPLNLAYIDYERFYHQDLRNANHRSLRFAIEDENGQHIGNTMCYDYNERRMQAEFGIMIGDRSYWGRGYGTDATRIAGFAHIHHDRYPSALPTYAHLEPTCTTRIRERWIPAI